MSNSSSEIRPLAASDIEQVAGGLAINQTPFARPGAPGAYQGLFGTFNPNGYARYPFFSFIPSLR